MKLQHLQPQHLRLLSPAVRFTGNPWGNGKPVLFATDVDECLMDWKPGQRSVALDNEKLHETKAAIRSARCRMYVGLNTARSIEKLGPLKPFLKGMSLDYLSLENGQEIYWNTRYQSTARWIDGLTHAKADASWNKTVSQTGWQLAPAKKIIRESLIQQGFTPTDSVDPHSPLTGALPNGQAVKIGFFSPRMSSFNVTIQNPLPDAQRYCDQLGEQVRKALASAGIQIDPVSFPLEEPSSEGKQVHFINAYRPKGIHKKAALDHIAQQLPGIRAVITAGDNIQLNDGQMLKATHFLTKEGVNAPNYAILTNAEPQIRALMPVSVYPRMEYAAPGALAQPLRQQLRKVDTVI
jgi:hydroxymethylpyrimidine pyrophosphatase-like HAD family hydrolase